MMCPPNDWHGPDDHPAEGVVSLGQLNRQRSRVLLRLVANVKAAPSFAERNKIRRRNIEQALPIASMLERFSPKDNQIPIEQGKLQVDIDSLALIDRARDVVNDHRVIGSRAGRLDTHRLFAKRDADGSIGTIPIDRSILEEGRAPEIDQSVLSATRAEAARNSIRRFWRERPLARRNCGA